MARAQAPHANGDPEAAGPRRSERQLNSATEPLAALTAWQFTERAPQWLDRVGRPAVWREMGPASLANGWGGMENAGRTTAIAIDPRNPNVLMVGAASGGLWRSTDGGGSWTPVGDYAPSLSFGAVAYDNADSRVVYAGTGEPHYSLDSFPGVGLLRSMDGGQSWELRGMDIFLGQSFTRVLPHPTRRGFLYVSTTGGVYRSTDSGGTWIKLLSGAVSDMVVDPRNPARLIAAVGYPWGSPANGLYYSSSSGDRWQKLQTGLPSDGAALARIQISSSRRFPDIVYTSFYNSAGGIRGIYKSTDFGASWVQLSGAPDYAGGQSWYDNYIEVSPFDPNVVFAGGTSTFRTVDGGLTWEDNTRSYAGGSIHPDHQTLTFSYSNPQVAYLGTDGGLFKTSNLGASWESLNKGLATIQFQHVDVHPTDPNIAYGGTQDNGTNKFEGQPTWRHVFTGDGGVTRVNPERPDVVYTEYVNLTISKSEDAGENWAWNVTQGIDLSEGALFYAPFNLDPSDPETLVAGTRRVYRTENGAVSWKPISPFLGGAISAITIAKSAREVIYAGTSDGRVWVTPNTGVSWYEVTGSLPRFYVGDLAVDPRNARHVYLAQVGWGQKLVWESTDAGGTWREASSGLPPAGVRMLAIHPKRPETLFAATDVGVFITENSGRSWVRYGRLPNVPVYSIVANATTGLITVGTHGRGAWRAPLP